MLTNFHEGKSQTDANMWQTALETKENWKEPKLTEYCRAEEWEEMKNHI